MADPIFRTTGPWGAGKGSNLEPEEVDANFWALLERIVAMEENPPTANEIANFVVLGTQMTVFMENGDSYGPFTLPTAQFAWTGEWLPNTEYNELDLVTVEGFGLYLVVQDHESASEFDPEEETSEGVIYRLMFGVPNRYEVAAYIPGRPGADFAPESASDPEPFWFFLNTIPLIVGADFAGSAARFITPPSGLDSASDPSAEELIYTVTTLLGDIGTLTFEAGSSIGVFSLGIPADSVLDAYTGIGLRADSGTDPVASGLSVTFVFTKATP